MKIGITLGTIRSDLWLAASVEADRLGYESVWMPEHLVLPVNMGGSPFTGADHPPIPPDIPVFDAFTYLAFIAARTNQIRLATHVYNIGLRHPFVTARGVATLDLVSGGRLDFGIGASWLEAEWRATGLDFETRGRRVDEAISVCQRLWSEEAVEHHGEFWDFEPVRFEPKPAQRPWPKMHIGGDGAAALRRAATVGDGWIPMNHSIDDIASAVTRLTSLSADCGRDGKVEVTLGAGDAGLEDLQRYEAAGVDRVLVRPWRRSREAIEGLRRYADEVMAKIVEN